ncbi:hypothetical protein OQ252_11915 [Acetobacter farinalis]|uniref:Helix-turn-helix domain-containing protein n=1 Tax=Acetobacter farinalis TaxID=1260984 RepID=A0ABT3QA08_9PROT|nr:hypothetical protein [Acetobacter farinalis]MCX2562095.1 hypothetical protein [Acetobacter farinalis]NHO30733.1 hypothetical protein [Acetobacter farinalis]
MQAQYPPVQTAYLPASPQFSAMSHAASARSAAAHGVIAAPAASDTPSHVPAQNTRHAIPLTPSLSPRYLSYSALADAQLRESDKSPSFSPLPNHDATPVPCARVSRTVTPNTFPAVSLNAPPVAPVPTACSSTATRNTASAIPQRSTPDSALHAAARPKTDAALLEQMVTLRRAGKSLRQIGKITGRCMESVRQALMRYEQAYAEIPAQYAEEEEWHDPLRDSEPLPPGHPVAVQALWHGLERWRGVV